MDEKKVSTVGRTLSYIIAGMGLGSFLVWSIVLVLLVIGNIVYWSGYPYELGPTSEDVLWGGVLHLLLIMFMILMTPIAIFVAGSGILTFIGGIVNVRKGRKHVLGISLVPNVLIFMGFSMLAFGTFLMISPDRVPMSSILLGPLIVSHLVRTILTVIVLFDRQEINGKKNGYSHFTHIHSGATSS